MLAADYPRFRALMAGMAKVFDKELDGVMLDAYWLTLRDWGLADFEAATANLMLHSEFMPRPAQFQKLRAASQPTKAEAWAKVLQHCKGPYRGGSGIDNGGPIDTAVAGLGGYKAIAFHDIDFLPVLGRRFDDRYAETIEANEARESLPSIVGPQKLEAIAHVAK